MADVRVSVPAPVGPAPDRQARLICGVVSATLPWWPDEISWNALAQEWSEQKRPGRAPMLVKEAQTLPELAIGFIASDRPSGTADTLLTALRSMAASATPVQLMLASRELGRWRVTDLAYTELEHAVSGVPIRAEVSLTLKRAMDASAPIGPLPQPTKGKGKGKVK
jgi:phage protein U